MPDWYLNVLSTMAAFGMIISSMVWAAPPPSIGAVAIVAVAVAAVVIARKGK